MMNNFYVTLKDGDGCYCDSSELYEIEESTISEVVYIDREGFEEVIFTEKEGWIVDPFEDPLDDDDFDY